MTIEVDIRKAIEDDRGSISKLVSDMHGTDVSKRISWLYDNNPHGKALTWLALERKTQETVGVTSLFPRKVIVDGKELVGSIGGDCYVAPRGRRLGIATRLHEVSRREMAGCGVQFMCGPPLLANLKALVAAGSKEVTRLARFSRLLRPDTGGKDTVSYLRRMAARGMSPSSFFARHFFTPEKVDRYQLFPATRFDQSWNDFVNNRRIGQPVTCVRDQAYLKWRYLEAPDCRQTPYFLTFDGELAGMLAMEVNADSAVIVDMVTRDKPNGMGAAFTLASTLAERHGCRSIDFYSTPYWGYLSDITRWGFVERDWHSPWIFQVLSPENCSYRETLESGSNWGFLFGDQEVLRSHRRRTG